MYSLDDASVYLHIGLNFLFFWLTAMFAMTCRFCHLPKEEHERHPMNQNILINHGISLHVLTRLPCSYLVMDVADNLLPVCFISYTRAAAVSLLQCRGHVAHVAATHYGRPME